MVTVQLQLKSIREHPSRHCNVVHFIFLPLSKHPLILHSSSIPAAEETNIFLLLMSNENLWKSMPW